MKRLGCWLFGHRVEVVQHFGDHATRLYCHDCKRQFVRKERGEWQGATLEWDEDFADLYRMMGHPIRDWPGGGT